MDVLASLLCGLLYHPLFLTDLPEKRFCTGRHSLGRCFCFGYCFYRYVADDEEESGKLVLVDCHEYCFDTAILCEALCVHQCVLLYFVVYGGMGTD